MFKGNVQQKPSSNLLPMLMLGTLFFIFGLVSWVNSILIPYFKVACELTHTQSYLVALAFYIAYLVMSIPAAKLIGRIGPKRGIIAGLWLMVAGTVLFVPAAYTRAYPVFLTGLFTIGTGLSILQTVANPYVTILGPIESAARRISIMGLCNKIAGIIAPLLFAAVILKSTDSELFEVLKSNSVAGAEKDLLLDELIRRVIVPYSILSLFLFLFGCAIHFIRLPDLSNEQEKSTHSSGDHKSIGSYPYIRSIRHLLSCGGPGDFHRYDYQLCRKYGIQSARSQDIPQHHFVLCSCGIFHRYPADSPVCQPATHVPYLHRRRTGIIGLCTGDSRRSTDVRTCHFPLHLVPEPDGSMQRTDLCRNLAACHT